MYVLRVLLVLVAIKSSSYNVEGFKILCDILSKGLNFLYCTYNHPQNVGCDNDDLKFHFYLHNERSDEEQKICPPDSCTYDFDPNQRTTIIVHGYLANRTAFWVPPLVQELRRWKKKMNVITVEWFKHIDYTTEAKAVVEVADRIARMVRERLFKDSIKKEKKIHIIGHSLGAHIAGLAASMLKNTAWPVDRVTGLDPAKPFFDLNENANLRLNKTVAEFVDVIHTNSDYQNSKTLGFFKPMGHIDFYPNGGKKQPECGSDREGKTFEEEGCFTNNTFALEGIVGLAWNLKVGLLGGRNMICEHEIAPVYFTKSTRARKFFGTKRKSLAEISKADSKCRDGKGCLDDQNCAEMGIHAEDYKGKREGIYYVKTDCGSKQTGQTTDWLDYLML